MRAAFVTGLLILAAVFGLQNVGSIQLSFIVWQVETRLVVALAIALLLGLSVGALLVLPWGVRAKKAAKGAGRELARLESEIQAERRLKRLPVGAPEGASPVQGDEAKRSD
jgi:uncharacterized integral membrane protein